jgi:hypothetical protein
VLEFRDVLWIFTVADPDFSVHEGPWYNGIHHDRRLARDSLGDVFHILATPRQVAGDSAQRDSATWLARIHARFGNGGQNATARTGDATLHPNEF